MEPQHFGRYDSQYDMRYRFMNGECHLLALELHDRLGWHLLAINTDDIVLHVAVYPPGHPDLMLDIKGLRPVESYTQDHPNSHTKHITENTVHKYIRQGHLYDDLPSCREVAEEAADLILDKLNPGE